jgi:6-phosphogluconate dehydrogenase (decarboxylating)
VSQTVSTKAETGQPFVDIVHDAAGMKGTGTWTVQTALDLGVPVSGIAEAVFARGLSSSTALREAAAGKLPGPATAWSIADRDAFIEDVRSALYASKIVAYAQGIDLIFAGATEYGWAINVGAVARIWRGGCIIRARFLNRITEAYDVAAGTETPTSLLLAPYFTDALARAQGAWRGVVAGAAQFGIPTPGFAAALAYYDGLRSQRLPAALIQGQRDFFGAHTYQRVDKVGTFHTLWSGAHTRDTNRLNRTYADISRNRNEHDDRLSGNGPHRDQPRNRRCGSDRGSWLFRTPARPGVQHGQTRRRAIRRPCHVPGLPGGQPATTHQHRVDDGIRQPGSRRLCGVQNRHHRNPALP